MPLLESDGRGLWCAAGGFHVDAWEPVPLSVVTHAHTDHARPGCGAYLCTEDSAAILRRRLGEGADVRATGYGDRIELGGTRVSLHPAGHVLGSAQVRIESGGETWVVTGDYKRAPDPTCAPFETVRCDVLVTEATFALPIYKWRAAQSAVRELVAFWDAARERGETAIVLCWALGKAQRILAELARLGIDRPVHAHGAIVGLTEVYRARGIVLPELRSATEATKNELAGALVLAPPSARGGSWIRRFRRARLGLASGWMQVRGDRRRRAVDRGFVLSDHADWPALLRTVDESGAKRVLVTHGFSDALARYLRETRGLETATLATRYEGESGAGEPAAPTGEGAPEPGAG